jgi:hypothetical protein
MVMTDEDLWEFVKLAGYLEGKAERGLFPKARFQRYSDALEALICYLAGVDDFYEDDDDDEHQTDNVVKFRPRHRPGGGRL